MDNPISAADGTDYRYTKHGRDWRVRVRVNSEISPSVSINGEHEVEASGVGISVSVAALDADGEVARSPDGKLRIFPAHVLSILAESFGRVDPQEEIERVIQEQIDAADVQLTGKDQLNAALLPFLKS